MILIQKLIRDQDGFILNRTFLKFLDFSEKALAKRERFAKIVLTEKRNPKYILKYSGKKTKISMPFEPF